MSSARPPLAHALVAFHRGEYSKFQTCLPGLRQLGFRWLTFVPTYFVEDRVPLRVTTESGPPLVEVADVIHAAGDAGFNIKLEPHLDWSHIATGPYEWRRRMYVQPQQEYAEHVLAPLFGIAAEAQRNGADCAFSLGSELAVSLAEFAPQWEALAGVLRHAHPEIAIGHNIDPDSLNPGTAIRNPLNQERARRQLPPLDWRAHREQLAAVHHYLGSLDYVGFSFYPNVRAARSTAWWRQQTTEIQTRIVGRAFLKEIQTLISRLRRMCGDKPQFVIGEFGIGSTDPTRPWHTDAKSFLTPEGAMNPGAAELRRKYYLGFLDCLRKHGHLFSPLPVTFWTVTHYDFLGALEQSGTEVFRDDILREAVWEYNRGC